MKKTSRTRVRTAIVIPVFNGFKFTRTCIESLLAYTHSEHPILIIDDASDDFHLCKWLSGVSNGFPHITVFRNDVNCGYTRSANRGIDLAAPDDVVVLNSDTIVSPQWIEKLRDTASSIAAVATVTPVSNAAGAFSVPIRDRNNRLPIGFTVDSMAELVERISPRQRPQVPTGNGFCMLISRKALDIVGGFDEKYFPIGYGEENDFCMRATQKGFVHLVDDTTFIFHHRNRSFGMKSLILRWRGRRNMRRLHPSYESTIASWLDDDPLDVLRKRIRTALQSGSRNAGGSPIP